MEGRSSHRIDRLITVIAIVLLASTTLQTVSAAPSSRSPVFKYQEQKNYCGIAVMQSFFPQLSQATIARELRKGKYDLTYWGDFNYFFKKHGIKYHYTVLNNEFPAIIMLPANTFGLAENHFVIVLGKKNRFYSIFDPEVGFYRKPETFLKGTKALVVE